MKRWLTRRGRAPEPAPALAWITPRLNFGLRLPSGTRLWVAFSPDAKVVSGWLLGESRGLPTRAGGEVLGRLVRAQTAGGGRVQLSARRDPGDLEGLVLEYAELGEGDEPGAGARSEVALSAAEARALGAALARVLETYQAARTAQAQIRKWATLLERAMEGGAGAPLVPPEDRPRMHLARLRDALILDIAEWRQAPPDGMRVLRWGNLEILGVTHRTGGAGSQVLTVWRRTDLGRLTRGRRNAWDRVDWMAEQGGPALLFLGRHQQRFVERQLRRVGPSLAATQGPQLALRLNGELPGEAELQRAIETAAAAKALRGPDPGP